MRGALIAACLLFILPCAASSLDWHVDTLDNGLKVMILENHQVPQVALSTTVQAGAKNETDYFDGATHFLEHLILFRGTEKMTGDEVAAAMKAHGAYFNGFTGSDWTDFVISLPSENLDFALQIHSDMLFRSNFPTEEMDKERQAVIEEINITEDDPWRKAYRTSLKVLFEGHPYSKNVLGTKENIRTIPRDSIYAYYKRYYAPNNMTTVIVGDVDPDQALALVKKYFGDIPRGTTPQDMYHEPPQRNKVEQLTIKRDIGQAYLMMTSIGPKADSKDQYALDLAATVLGSGESSRLWKKLKDELGLVYSINYSFYTSKYEGTLLTFAVVDPDKVGPVENAINDVLNEVKRDGFTERELRKAKNIIKTGHFAGMQRLFDIADKYAQYSSFINYQFVEDYPGNIENVSLAEMNEVARKYFNTDSYVKTTVVPR